MVLAIAWLGCTPMYHPPSIHVTNFDTAGQSSFRASAGTNGGQLQAAHAVGEKVALRGAAHGVIDDGGVYGTVGGGPELYKATRRSRIGLAVEGHVGFVGKTFDNTTRRAPLFQVALPLTVGWVWDWVEAGLASRILLHTTYGRSWQRPRGGFLVRPIVEGGGFVRIGKTWQVELATGISMVYPLPDRPDPGFEYSPLSASIGIVHRR